MKDTQIQNLNETVDILRNQIESRNIQSAQKDSQSANCCRRQLVFVVLSDFADVLLTFFVKLRYPLWDILNQWHRQSSYVKRRLFGKDNLLTGRRSPHVLKNGCNFRKWSFVCSIIAWQKISIRAKRSISPVFSLFIVPSPFFVHCPYKGRINRAESVLIGLKPY